MHSKKVDPEEIIMFWIKKSKKKNQNLIMDKKNLKLKIILSEQIYPKEIIVFRKRGMKCNFICTFFKGISFFSL